VVVFVGIESSLPVPLTIDGEAIIGRADEEAGYMPELDLSPFDARDGGVSRRHAVLIVENGTLFVADLNSVNGTRINGVELGRDQRSRVRHGDVIEVGRLRLTVYFVD
jgi:serine/threonine-protein kinase